MNREFEIAHLKSSKNLPDVAEVSVLCARRAGLVDKKFLEGLSTEELLELEQLSKRLDELYAPFYEPIIQCLTDIEKRLATQHSKSRTKGK